MIHWVDSEETLTTKSFTTLSFYLVSYRSYHMMVAPATNCNLPATQKVCEPQVPQIANSGKNSSFSLISPQDVVVGPRVCGLVCKTSIWPATGAVTPRETRFNPIRWLTRYERHRIDSMYTLYMVTSKLSVSPCTNTGSGIVCIVFSSVVTLNQFCVVRSEWTIGSG